MGFSCHEEMRERFSGLKTHACAWVLVMALCASAQAVIIFTESFEDPAVTGFTNTNPTGWTELGGGSAGGINDEDTGAFTTPYGSQVAWANGTNQFITSGSILSDVLTAATTYTLDFNIAKRNTLSGGTYRVELLAGATVLATVTGTPLLSDFSESDQIVFTPDGSHAALLGQTLAIRFGTDGSFQPQFDNFILDATAVPEPSAACLLGLAACGLLIRRSRHR